MVPLMGRQPDALAVAAETVGVQAHVAGRQQSIFKSCGQGSSRCQPMRRCNQHTAHGCDVGGHDGDVVTVAVGPAAAVPAQDDRRIVCAGWAKNVVAVQTVRALGNIPIGMDAGRQWLSGPNHDSAGIVVSGLEGMGAWQSG